MKNTNANTSSKAPTPSLPLIPGSREQAQGSASASAPTTMGQPPALDERPPQAREIEWSYKRSEDNKFNFLCGCVNGEVVFTAAPEFVDGRSGNWSLEVFLLGESGAFITGGEEAVKAEASKRLQAAVNILAKPSEVKHIESDVFKNKLRSWELMQQLTDDDISTCPGCGFTYSLPARSVPQTPNAHHVANGGGAESEAPIQASEVVPAPGLPCEETGSPDSATREAVLTQERPNEETGLVPCPFCGNIQYLRYCRNAEGMSEDVEQGTFQGVDGIFSIICRECGARGPETSLTDRAISVVRWNKRPPQTSSPSTTPTAPRSVEGEKRLTVGEEVKRVFTPEVRAAFASPPLEAKTGSVEVEGERDALRAETPGTVGEAARGGERQRTGREDWSVDEWLLLIQTAVPHFQYVILRKNGRDIWLHDVLQELRISVRQRTDRLEQALREIADDAPQSCSNPECSLCSHRKIATAALALSEPLTPGTHHEATVSRVEPKAQSLSSAPQLPDHEAKPQKDS